MTKEQEKLVEKTRYLIGELSNIQELYFTTLVDELGVFEGEEDWLFDYIHNESDFDTFEEFLANYGKTVDEVLYD